MGSFVIIPSSVGSGGTPFQDTGPVGDYDGWYTNSLGETVYSCMISPGALALTGVCGHAASPSSFADTIRLVMAGACIYLDGSLTPIGLNDLPAGFTPTAAILLIGSSENPNPTANFWLQAGPLQEGAMNDSSYHYSFTPTPPTMLEILSNGCGYRISLAAGTNENSSVNDINSLQIQGDYEIVSYSWTLVQPTERVNTGDTITVTSDPNDPNPLDLDDVDTIDIIYTDENGDEQDIPVAVIHHENPFLLTFIMPDLLSIGDPPGIIIVSITSSQFSGSVELGKLFTIYFLNAPGIYRLVANKTNDTLYDIENGGTADIKIPNPFFKTGFIDG